jgi:hypothetical protein
MAKKAKKKVAKATKATKTAKKAAPKKVAKKVAKKASNQTAPARQEWTPAALKELKVLIKQNTPTRLIALKLNRSAASIYNKVAKEGLSLAPTNRSPRD